jgi:hypothetical protein
VFQLGYDNALFVFDDIKFVDRIKLEVYGQGQSRKVRYVPDFDKEVEV